VQALTGGCLRPCDSALRQFSASARDVEFVVRSRRDDGGESDEPSVVATKKQMLKGLANVSISLMS